MFVMKRIFFKEILSKFLNQKKIAKILCLLTVMLLFSRCGPFCPKTEEWQYLGLENELVTSIAVDPMNSDIIYVGTSAGTAGKLLKSIDGGETWDTLLVGGFKEILIDPSNSNIIYAISHSLVKSDDAGETWQEIADGIRIDWQTRVGCLAINPLNPNVLYAGTGGFFGGNIYKSNDGGLHWQKTPSDSLGDGISSIAIDPVDTNIVYAGTAGRCIIWKTIDSGVRWFRTNLSGESIIHDILIDPGETSTVYAASRGIFKTKDGGLHWIDISYEISSETTNVIKIKKSKDSRLFLVATFGDDGGIYEYSIKNNEWLKIGINSQHVSYYYCDLKYYTNPDRLYFAGSKTGVYVKYLY